MAQGVKRKRQLDVNDYETVPAIVRQDNKCVFSIRLYPRELEAFRDEAKRRGQTISEFMRLAALKDLYSAATAPGVKP